jgi:ATP-dependent DNA helicase RecQ
MIDERPRSLEEILKLVQKYWGFSELRPLQEEAIRAGLDRRDSLVVMPTGGGKSLCYQVPAALTERTDIVVSPLIALMKDQVDALRESGYPAAAIYSGMPFDAIRETQSALVAGKYRVLFVAPERLLTSRFLELVQRLPSPSFAIDEAHCISHWGHDFRPEYRQLADLKTRFPKCSVHAYTATATERVRTDIVTQLRLENPAVLVGTFDRPNLVYRIIPRVDSHAQVLDVLRRHRDQAAIVYCISRKDTEAMAEFLQSRGIRAAFYHAGMEAEKRRKTQDAFAAERIDVVAATVAFGMGIDRSDVRAVIHAAMPKSIEHYQQETGRAGRDGLEAECVLLYSAADAIRWESLIEKSAEEAAAPQEVVTASRQLLDQMRRFCAGVQCRHRRLSAYFGQHLSEKPCGACDVCLNEIEGLEDATITSQKILSCVARTGERFGVEHIVDVLLGAQTDRIRRWGHEKISTYGLMQGSDRKPLANMVYQLLDEGLLDRTAGDRPILKLNGASWEVMRGQRSVHLLEAKTKIRKARVEVESWEGVDEGLFEKLRSLRRKIADQRGVPAYVLFNDSTLRDMARLRPGSTAALATIRGIGERKLADLGSQFLKAIEEHCRANGLSMNNAIANAQRARSTSRQSNEAKSKAFEMFAQNASVIEVAAITGRAVSTAWSYLAEFVQTNRSHPLDAWIERKTRNDVESAAKQLGTLNLKPIHDYLLGRVPFEQIRIAVSRLIANGLTFASN